MAARVLDPYTVLGIPPGATREEAARAHRRLAKAFHPDVNQGSEAAERMRRINEAWRILSSPARRARHDARRGTASWAGRNHSWAGGTHGARTGGATAWTTWPHSAPRPTPRTRRPAPPAPVEPGFGDRPAVIVIAWATMVLLVFVGTWLGSVTP